jgi:hypothetical protein
MNTRLLLALGIADLAAGVVLWVVTGNAVLGIALLAVGAAVLGVAATRRGSDPDAALRNQRADRQRLHDETHASAESAEDRPPPTGG